MSRYSDFFLTSRSTVAQLNLFEIAHPSFSQTYRIVANHAEGVTVDLSDQERGVRFDFYPVTAQPLGARDDMDAAVRIAIAEVGEVVPAELDRVEAAGTWAVKPTVRYWLFRSDDLSAPIYGPLALEIADMAFNQSGVSFEAKAPQINANRTGERYTLDRFPMLRGAL